MLTEKPQFTVTVVTVQEARETVKCLQHTNMQRHDSLCNTV